MRRSDGLEIRERFYRITHACGSGMNYTETYVFFRWPCKLPKHLIVPTAVETGEMLDNFIGSVVDAREITRDEYFEHMTE